MEGFSPSNIGRMRAFFLSWTDAIIARPVRESEPAISAQLVPKLDSLRLPQVAASIPWGQNIMLFQKVKDPTQRIWYAGKSLEHGWSRSVLRHEDDRPSIGMILCKSRKKLIAEYALRDTNKPIGVSAFTLTKALPEKLKGTLPTIKEIEEELL